MLPKFPSSGQLATKMLLEKSVSSMKFYESLLVCVLGHLSFGKSEHSCPTSKFITYSFQWLLTWHKSDSWFWSQVRLQIWPVCCFFLMFGVIFHNKIILTISRARHLADRISQSRALHPMRSDRVETRIEKVEFTQVRQN